MAYDGYKCTATSESYATKVSAHLPVALIVQLTLYYLYITECKSGESQQIESFMDGIIRGCTPPLCTPTAPGEMLTFLLTNAFASSVVSSMCVCVRVVCAYECRWVGV